MKTLKQTIRLLAVTAIGFGLLAVLFTQLNVVAKAAPADQLDVCATCTYTTIQTAVDAANPGDTIRVAQGTYQDIVTSPGLLTSTVIITKDLTLIGGYSPDFQTHDPSQYETIVDGQNIGKGFYVSGSYAHIEGFTVINGYTQGILVRESAVNNAPAGATLVNNHIHDNVSGIVFYRAEVTAMGNMINHNSESGVAGWESPVIIISNTIAQNNSGGIWVDRSLATITGNTIVSNTAEGGAGIVFESATHFTVTHNIINNNQAQLYSGGGIAVWGGGNTGSISYNEIAGNDTADHGGGIAIYLNDEIAISHNEIRQNLAQYGGGGIHINYEESSAPLTIEQNFFSTNTAEYGAGLHLINTNGDVVISRNNIQFNQTTGPDYSSGGIYVDNVGGKITVVNNDIANNDNRGVKGVNYAEIELINNTIVGNGTSAIEMHAWPVTSTVPMTTTLINNIIADHPDCAFFGFYGAVFAVHSNDVVGHDLDDCGAVIVAQSNNINADPLFVDANNGNFQLQATSPAIDSGTTGANVPNVDIEGNLRPQGSGVDMGAYEATRYALFLPVTVKPVPVPSDNFTIVNQAFGQGYSAYSGDVHAWLSNSDGWGFAPQDPDNVTFYRWNGTEWNSFQTLPSGGWYCFGADLHMLSATEGWVVAPRDCTNGPSTFFRWDGNQWAEVQSGISSGIWAIDFRSSNDGWAVGYTVGCCGAKFFHWDGTSWTEQKYLISHWPVSDMALLDNGDGWAVGSSIARQSGNDWIVYSKPVSESLYAISMVSANDGWAVGEAGTILHWNGTAWTAVASPTTEDLRDIEMVQTNHGWAVGKNGTILRWNGSVWSQISSPVTADFGELDMVGVNEGWIPYYHSGTANYGVLHITAP